MERVHELIDKLQQQRQQHASAPQLMATVQLLHDALLAVTQKDLSAISGKVAVVMPARVRVTPQNTVATPAATPVQQEKQEPEVHAAHPAVFMPTAKSEQQSITATPHAEPAPAAPAVVVTPPNPPQAYVLQKPAVPEPAPQQPPAPEVQPYMPPAPEPQPAAKPEPKQQPNLFDVHFDPIEETPTLLQQTPKLPPKEIHELISEQKESFNDRLKQDRPEMSHFLKEAPIKDLRKAIGVNDKFQFINELFRGDEAMYERSIKTINGFHILPEAEYWINRELKVKLGWTDSRDIVQHFYQLVRRRFS